MKWDGHERRNERRAGISLSDEQIREIAAEVARQIPEQTIEMLASGIGRALVSFAWKAFWVAMAGALAWLGVKWKLFIP